MEVLEEKAQQQNSRLSNPGQRSWEVETPLTKDMAFFLDNYKHARARTYLRNEHQNSEVRGGVPVTVEDVSEDSLRVASIGTALAVEEPEEKPTSFVEYLKSWGGDWMWEDLRLCESSLEWIVEGSKKGTLVCVTDGSYFKKKAPNVCSAGWIIADQRTKRQIGGMLVEISPSVDSYRGKMLGMLAI